MARSRRGLTTKIHPPVHTAGLPMALRLTAGQAHDGRSATDIFDTLGDGNIPADRAYDSDALRIETAARGAWANIKAMPNAPFRTETGRQRSLVPAAARCRCSANFFLFLADGFLPMLATAYIGIPPRRP